MDYRKREYWAIMLNDYERDLKYLKENVHSLKILRPYNHYKITITNAKQGYTVVHDSDFLHKYIQIVVSFKIEDKLDFMNAVNNLSKESNHFHITPYNKNKLGQ